MPFPSASALKALQELHAGKYPDMRAATASSADTPHAVAIGRAALSILEVVPGVTVRQVCVRSRRVLEVLVVCDVLIWTSKLTFNRLLGREVWGFTF